MVEYLHKFFVIFHSKIYNSSLVMREKKKKKNSGHQENSNLEAFYEISNQYSPKLLRSLK